MLPIRSIGIRLACAVPLVIVSGCGSLFSRGMGAPFGGYPFEAVALDAVFICSVGGPGQQVLDQWMTGDVLFFWGLLSLPFDLLMDTIMLPVDLGAWACGHHKMGRT